MHADWLKIVFLLLDGERDVARAADIMMARAKRIYISIINANKFNCFPFHHGSVI